MLNKRQSHGKSLDTEQRNFQSKEMSLDWIASAHPNIVSMHKILADPDCTYVILDYFHEGDLFANIIEGGGYVDHDTLLYYSKRFMCISDYYQCSLSCIIVYWG